MGYLVTIGLSVFVFGILFLIMSKTNKKFLWAAIPLLIAGALTIFNVVNKDVDTDLIGMEILKDNPQEFLVELHYFSTKDEAFTYYREKNVVEFILMASYEGKAEDLFKMINIKQTPDGGKKMVFFENPLKRESAQMIFQRFYTANKLFTVYNSAKRPKK